MLKVFQEYLVKVQKPALENLEEEDLDYLISNFIYQLKKDDATDYKGILCSYYSQFITNQGIYAPLRHLCT